MTPEVLLECFVEVAAAVRDALAPIDAVTRRERTNVGGQYALDLIADDAALAVLRKLPVRVVLGAEFFDRTKDIRQRVCMLEIQKHRHRPRKESDRLF